MDILSTATTTITTIANNSNSLYYDIYNNNNNNNNIYDRDSNPFDITNTFPLSYHMISTSLASGGAAAAASSSDGLQSILLDHRDRLSSTFNNYNNQQSIMDALATTAASTATQLMDDFIIDSRDFESIDGDHSTYHVIAGAASGKMRNPVDPNLAFWAVVDGVLLVFILGGNFLTIVAVRFSRRLRSITSNLFVLSLAISDILVGFTLPYHLAFYMGSGLGKTKEYCLLRFFLIILACCNSIWNLIAIAVDRYIAIFFPLHYSRYMTKKVALTLLGFGWVVGITFATIPLIWNNWDTATQCEFDEIFKPWYMAGVITPGFCAVWVCMLIVYLRIWREATKHAKQLRSSFTGLHETPSDSKSVQVVLFILGCFSFCWLPYFVIACVQIFRYVDKSSPMLYKAAFSLAMANSGMNPIIYAWKNTGFRRAFARLMRCQSPDYNDASQHSIRSLNKQRKSSASQQHQKSCNTISMDGPLTATKFRINETAHIRGNGTTPCALQHQSSSVSITSSNIIPSDGISFTHNPNTIHHQSSLMSTSTPSASPAITTTDKRFHYANRNNCSSIGSCGTIKGGRKSSLKRTESSDDDRTSTPHGVFPRKTSFGTVTTTIINTSTDDDDGDYEYSYHRAAYENIAGVGAGVAGICAGAAHHNVLMSTIVSLDDISLVATTATIKSASSYTLNADAISEDVKPDQYSYRENPKYPNTQQCHNHHNQHHQQEQKVTKCIASIRNVGEMLQTAKNSVTTNGSTDDAVKMMGRANDVGARTYREGFIIEKIECDGNGNNTTKCVCVLNAKELKRKLKNLNWSNQSSMSVSSNTSNNISNCTSSSCSGSTSYNNIIMNELKTNSCNNSRPKCIKTIANPMEHCTNSSSSNSSSSNYDKDLQQQQQQQQQQNGFGKISNGDRGSDDGMDKTNNTQVSNNSGKIYNVQKLNRKNLCNGNHVINCKNSDAKCCKTDFIV